MSKKVIKDPFTGEPEKLCDMPGCKSICSYIVKFEEGAIYNACRKCFLLLIDMASSRSLKYPYTLTILPMKCYEQCSNPKIG